MKDLIDIYFGEFIDEWIDYLMYMYKYLFGDCIKEWMKGLIKEWMGKLILKYVRNFEEEGIEDFMEELVGEFDEN